MNKEILYELSSPYRNNLIIKGYTFGHGSLTAAIVGPMRGNEVQQLYICSQLIAALTALEKKGSIAKGNQILVIPSINHFGMNIDRRLWPLDNSDINRKFPGSSEGDTTEQIAAGILDKLKGCTYGIQLSSFYMPGDFIPHVRLINAGYSNSSLATLFGLKYVLVRNPKTFDTTTLNYNWQIEKTQAFSVYTNQTDRVDEASAQEAVTAILRFLSRMGIIKYRTHSGYISSILDEDHLISIKAPLSGIVRMKTCAGKEVSYKEVLAEIIHPYEGNVIGTIQSPTTGAVFFVHNHPMVMENQVIFKLIHRQHM
ncbi:MAG: succinylglutamate desuccinylase/aspartoacylase family protein [Vallitaleaceae bacterium]|nr:succinylglutamate desuccinylase/aspartoacylase family protein [Vallitaleaceae bacterium]